LWALLMVPVSHGFGYTDDVKITNVPAKCDDYVNWERCYPTDCTGYQADEHNAFVASKCPNDLLHADLDSKCWHAWHTCACPDSGPVPCGYDSYSANAAVVGCEKEYDGAFRKAATMYAEFPIIKRGHTMEIKFDGMGDATQLGAGAGDWAMFSVSGKQSGKNTACSMMSGVQMFICKDCTCPDGTIKLHQFNKMVSPERVGERSECGKWFAGVSNVMQMLYANLREFAMQNHPTLKACMQNDDVSTSLSDLQRGCLGPSSTAVPPSPTATPPAPTAPPTAAPDVVQEIAQVVAPASQESGPCVALWGACTNGETCCEGIPCIGDQWYKQCKHAELGSAKV